MRALPDILPTEMTGLSECLDRLAAHKRELRPLSTYRLQFHKGFRFDDARELAEYLYELGISHVYSSPILKARPGSAHGYDIADHNLLNPEVGSDEDFRRFVERLKQFGIGQILDVVPNHMGVGQGDNPWWQDVLQNGQAAEHACFFDIDWDPLKPELRHKVLLPILANQYGQELEEGRIQLAFDIASGRFQVRYYETVLPVDPQTIPIIFEQAWPKIAPQQDSINGNDSFQPLKDALRALQQLPPHTDTRPELVAERRRCAPVLLDQLAQMILRSQQTRELMDRALFLINGQPLNGSSFDGLHHLLERQAYRLAHWRVSTEEINYRRFFDINDLVGLCMENPRVFAATHKLLRKLLADNSISGIRIDHCDGLLNPRQHLVRVQMLYAASQCYGAEPIPPLAENGIEISVQRAFGQHDWMNQHAPLYAIVEKILGPGEDLPTEWPIDGTSGYDFVNLVNGIFIRTENRAAFDSIYHRFIGEQLYFDSLLYRSKKMIMNTALSSEVNVLAHILDVLSSNNRRARDFTRKALRDAIRETIACFPVYRAYIDERGEINQRDADYVNKAIALAKRRNAGTAAAVFDFLRDILLLRGAGHESDSGYSLKLHFTLKFQQLTGPVMAKGLEDTVCYVYNRFISVNEVGSSPKLFGHSLEEFHRGNQLRAERWPFSLLATSTHDTKRSEDVRARLNVLSEMPKQWSSQVLRWSRVNQAKKITLADGRQVPDTNEEYLLYQTLIGSWPFLMESEEARNHYIERISQYMIKAIHEAKINLSWINPDPEYVDAMSSFIRRVLTPGPRIGSNFFVSYVKKFLPAVQFFGAMNSLAQTLLKITSPGVPDTYQGTELWDFSLVDPDNRRPVDFNLRRKLLSEIKTGMGDFPSLCADLLAHYIDGRIKFFTTLRALRFRSENPELFRLSAYVPMEAVGDKREHVCAFAREHSSPMECETQVAIVAVPRFSYTLMKGRIAPPIGEVWGNTELHVSPNTPAILENVLTGEMVNVSNRRTILCRELFSAFPVALLAGR